MEDTKLLKNLFKDAVVGKYGYVKDNCLVPILDIDSIILDFMESVDKIYKNLEIKNNTRTNSFLAYGTRTNVCFKSTDL